MLNVTDSRHWQKAPGARGSWALKLSGILSIHEKTLFCSGHLCASPRGGATDENRIFDITKEISEPIIQYIDFVSNIVTCLTA